MTAPDRAPNAAPDTDPVSAALQDAADQAAADVRRLHDKAIQALAVADKMTRVGALCEPGAQREYYAAAHKRALATAELYLRAADAIERDARR